MMVLAARSVLGITGTLFTGAVFSVSLRGQDAPQAVIVDPTTPAQQEIQSIGVTAIDRLAVSLANEVKSAVSGGEPEDSLDMCHLKGLPVTPGEILRGMPRIAAVKLTSSKIRASDNDADAEDRAALDYIDQAFSKDKAAPGVVVQRIDTPGSPPEWRVYKPIATTANCLICHGNPAEQSANLRAKLKEFYPEDAAAGDKWHDWRGIIRVSVSDGTAN